MSGKGESRDPFAGYTPVKPRFSSVGQEVADLSQERPSGGRVIRRRSEKEGNFVRTVKLLAWLAVAAVLVALVAAVSFGFLYESTVEDRAPELASCSDQIGPLAKCGQRVREWTRGVLPTNDASFSVRRIPVVSNFMFRAKTVKGAEVRDADELREDPHEPLPAPAAASAATSAPPRKVDVKLKSFFNGGRRGRPLR